MAQLPDQQRKVLRAEEKAIEIFGPESSVLYVDLAEKHLFWLMADLGYEWDGHEWCKQPQSEADEERILEQRILEALAT